MSESRIEPGSPQWIKRVQARLDEEGDELALWYQDYADTDGWKGAVIVEATGFTSAFIKAGALGISPGGEVVGFRVWDTASIKFPRHLLDRLLQMPELEAHFGEMERIPDDAVDSATRMIED